jgi:hypothetical protein
MADETIVIRFVADTNAAIKQAQAYRLEIEKAKEQIQEYAKQHNVSQKQVADALKKTYESERKSKIEPVLSSKGMRAAQAQARADIQQYSKSVNEALKMIQAEERQVVIGVKEELVVREQLIKAEMARARLVGTRARATGREVRSDATLHVAKNDSSAQVAQAKAAAQVQIAASRAATVAQIKAQEAIRAQLRTTTQAQIEAAKIAIAQTKAQAAAQAMALKNTEAQARIQAQITIANTTNMKKVADAQKAQALADIQRANAQAAQAKASFAYQNAQSESLILQAKAAQAQALAAVAPQLAQQRVQQSIYQTTQAAAKAQGAYANATNASANASNAAAMSNAKLSQAQNNAAASALRAARGQQVLATNVNRSSSLMSAMGKIASFAFGNVIGTSVYSTIERVIELFQRAVQGGVEFSNSIYRLGASVRALQRLGMDITISETVDQVEKLREQFGFMSRKEAVDGVAAVQLLTRNFGFTKEQIYQMTEAATTLAVITGKDFGETARELALFLSSGYAESLQRAGLAVNRLTVAEKAQEMGIKKGYPALTEYERAAAGLALVLEEIAPIIDEVANYQNSLAGNVAEVNASIKNQEQAIQNLLAPVALLGLQIKKLLIEVLIRAFNSFQRISGMIQIFVITPVTAMFKTLVDAYMSFFNGDWMDPGQFYAKLKENLNQIQRNILNNTVIIPIEPELDASTYKEAGEDLSDAVRDGFKKNSDEIRQEMSDAVSDGADEIVELVRDMNKDLQDAQQELFKDMGGFDPALLDSMVDMWSGFLSQNQDLTVDELEDQQEIWEGFFGEFGSITDDGLNDAWEIWRDYFNKLSDISQKEQEDIADAQRELSQDLEDLERDTQQKLEDAARKYREEELKAERDYQEKLRRLREEYLFDLEDALRERDALQVIRLMRRYQLDKQQLEREHDDESQQRAEDYRREIEDIRRQAARKAEELQIENQRRLQEIKEQAERERQEAAIARDQAIAELKQKLEDERKERQLAYEQELEDLKKRFEDEITTILEKLGEQYNLTDEEMKKLAGVFQSILGANGPIAGAYSEFAGVMGNMTQTIANSVAQALAYLNQLRAAQAEAVAITAAIQQQQSSYSGPNLSPNGPINGAPLNSPNMAPGNMSPNGPINGPTSYALGGTAYANRPTLALFGESGPEIASFMPVNRMNTNNKSPVSRGLGTSGGSGGTVRVEVALGPDLEARIIDNTLGQSAEIIETALSGRS